MALADGGSLGAAQAKASSSTIALTVTASVAVGDGIVVRVGVDNQQTTDGASTEITAADDSANAYLVAVEDTESSGAAADGVCHATLYCEKATGALTSGVSVITATLANAQTARTIEARVVTMSAGNKLAVEGTQRDSAASGQPGAITLSGLTSREYYLVHGYCREGTLSTFTPGTGYTAWTGIGTTGGVGDTNIGLWGAYRIATLTTDNPDAVVGTGAQFSQTLVAFYETASASSLSPPALQERRSRRNALLRM